MPFGQRYLWRNQADIVNGIRTPWIALAAALEGGSAEERAERRFPDVGCAGVSLNARRCYMGYRFAS